MLVIRGVIRDLLRAWTVRSESWEWRNVCVTIMVRKEKCGRWKTVQLTENLISKGVDGLVGIEELTDYKLVKDYGAKINRKVGRELHGQYDKG
jgi:hypothetical protein